MFKRYLNKKIEEGLEDSPAILILGARQIGKSTFCRQLISEGSFEGISVTMDDPAVLLAAQADPMGFLIGLGKKVVIDEVQRAPELFLSIKKLIDDDRNRRIILTGSANVMFQPKVADSLAGRIEVHRLWPLSQDEMLGKPSNFLNNLLSPQTEFQSMKLEWDEFIQIVTIGGYPEVVKRKRESRRSKWIEDYLESILQKDIRDLANIDGLLYMPKILSLLSTRVGSTVNMSDVARLAGIKSTSFQRYISLLEQIFLIVKIPAWTPNEEGQYVKSPKIFLNDTAILCHFKGEQENIRIDRTKAGLIVENFIALELLKQLSWYDKHLKIFHFSIHKGREVDLVIEDRNRNIYGIEVKTTMTLRENDFSGLRKLAEVAGGKFKKGIVLYTGEHFLHFGNNLFAVPMENLWKS